MVGAHAFVDKKGMLDKLHLGCSPPLEIEMIISPAIAIVIGERVWCMFLGAAAVGGDDIATSISSVIECIVIARYRSVRFATATTSRID